MVTLLGMIMLKAAVFTDSPTLITFASMMLNFPGINIILPCLGGVTPLEATN